MLPVWTVPATDKAHGVWREPESGVDVELHPCHEDSALLCGRIVRLPENGPKVDLNNQKPPLRQRPLLGLEILTDFQPVAGTRWEGGGDYGRNRGRIYLPENGDTLGDHQNRYEIRFEEDRLVIGIANCSLLSCLRKSVWRRTAAM